MSAVPQAQGRRGWAEHSRELEIACDGEGRIVHADARALKHLGLKPGDSLLAAAAPGMQQKIQSVLERGSRSPLDGAELALVSDGAVTTYSFQARPGSAPGEVELLGCCLPQEHSASLRSVQESMQEIVALNREVIRQKQEIERQKAELERAVRELDESNKGIRTLHQELEDKAEVLQRTAEVKSRVVANVSHEFRTPLHTILGLSRLLLETPDAPLSDEQRRQVQFIRGSAEELSAVVDDMLDLSAAEAGKSVLRPERFLAGDFFASLRGTLRPLVQPASQVQLEFVDPPAGLTLETDQGKLAQIVRNLVTNALKFTERGHVRVWVEQHGENVAFKVQDTGIGIAEADFERVFEEFGQVDSPTQRRVKGSGLGLPLSRRFADLLGGTLEVESAPGRGSTFTVDIPRVHPEVSELAAIEAQPLDPARAPILVVEDDRKTIFLYERYLKMTGFQVVPARTIVDAERLLKTLKPAAIVLDIMLEGESSWNFLTRVKQDPATKDIPVLVVTVTGREQKARALGADEFWLKPVDQDRLIAKLRSLRHNGSRVSALLVDDDDMSRYLIRKMLEGSPYLLLEAATGNEGVRLARERRPSIILLDFLLDNMTAFDVLDELKGDPATRLIPVIVVTSHKLERAQLERLAVHTDVVLSKGTLSRELAIHRIRDALQKHGVMK